MSKLRYKRQGQCIRCGVCCLTEGKDGGPCKYLKLAGGGKQASCLLINHPERPQKCKIFPQAPPILIDTCGYYFLDTWEEDRIVRVREV